MFDKGIYWNNRGAGRRGQEPLRLESDVTTDKSDTKHYVQVGNRLVPASRVVARRRNVRRKYTRGGTFGIKGASRNHVFKPAHSPSTTNHSRMMARKMLREAKSNG